MKLNKRYFRSMKSNLSFYVSSSVLTIMTLFLYFMMNIAGSAIWKFGDDFFNETDINPPAELGRLADASGDKQSTSIIQFK